ncbi:MAG TPA: multicopper oxidase domain-containing protein [Gemmatimonadales bacterium]|jgi:FtsP/CotA-like multicopper oxidase with cupredoxin domain|nr:multicopper oxidase domain-containing protein [Gemmatimonadales bacterium]
MTEETPLRLAALLSAAGLGALALVGASRGAESRALPNVVANDNRIPAGRLRHDTLSLELEVRLAHWRPEALTDSGVVVAAFAEVGKAPQIPAPLIRVRTGTIILATIRNALPDSTITLRGLASHPTTPGDTTRLAPGQSRQLSFAAGAPGTYLYLANLGARDIDKDPERESAAGALVVDPLEGSPADRIFVINIWGDPIDSAGYANAVTINGRSWPWTERIAANVGDTLRWRWVNASVRNHPMHLHGFYFTLEARGNGLSDSVLAAPRPLLVTHDVRAFETFAMSWIPERPGNWLYHCHIAFHVLPGAATLNPADTTAHQRMSDDPTQHMAGLILGISVATPPRWKDPSREHSRRLRLFVQEGAKRGRAPRSLGFVLQSGATPPAPDSVAIPGSLLVLTRGEPTDISIINRLREPAAIHWHGIELESYSDGVAGWSGALSRVAPSVQPGDSFVARLTLPRAGTFMYHTHMNDLEQLTSGLYGPIVVLEPGARFDPARDHIFIGGWDGTQEPQHLLINGDSIPRAPLELTAGVVHRFRFINIGPAGGYWPTLRQDTTLLQWRHVAKDGAELRAAQAVPRRARFRIQVGETWDVEWTPTRGEYTLALGERDKPAFIQRIVVR